MLRINRYRNLDSMEGELLQKKEKFHDILEFIKKELNEFKTFYLPVASGSDLADRK